MKSPLGKVLNKEEITMLEVSEFLLQLYSPKKRLFSPLFNFGEHIKLLAQKNGF